MYKKFNENNYTHNNLVRLKIILLLSIIHLKNVFIIMNTFFSGFLLIDHILF